MAAEAATGSSHAVACQSSLCRGDQRASLPGLRSSPGSYDKRDPCVGSELPYGSMRPRERGAIAQGQEGFVPEARHMYRYTNIFDETQLGGTPVSGSVYRSQTSLDVHGKGNDPHTKQQCLSAISGQPQTSRGNLVLQPVGRHHGGPVIKRTLSFGPLAGHTAWKRRPCDMGQAQCRWSVLCAGYQSPGNTCKTRQAHEVCDGYLTERKARPAPLVQLDAVVRGDPSSHLHPRCAGLGDGVRWRGPCSL